MSSATGNEAGLTRHRGNSKTNSYPLGNCGRTKTLMDNEDSLSRGPDRRWVGPVSSCPPYPHHKPLIERCTNEWQHSSRWKSQQDASTNGIEEALESFFDRCLAVLKAPKIRRYLLLYTIVFVFSLWLWSSIVWPVWKEQRALSWSLSADNRRISGGLFGSNLRPTFPNMIQVKDLDPRYIPKASATKHLTAEKVNRIVFVGDVHGCVDELTSLLERVGFNAKRDHLITTGDLIGKGPESGRTIDFVRDIGASCVRGNQEDRILLTANEMNSMLRSPARPGVDNGNEQLYFLSDSPDRALAASLSAEQISYLEGCPVILRVGFLKHLAGDLVVVHAGLIPGLPLERQDPTAVMSMRSIDLHTHVPSKASISEGGVHWIKLWNKYQQSLPAQWSLFPAGDRDVQKSRESHTTVIYGHDAKAGLQLKQYSKGIDTGCVRGGKLTALVLSDGGSMQTVQVKCKDYRKLPFKVEEDVPRDGKLGEIEDRSVE